MQEIQCLGKWSHNTKFILIQEFKFKSYDVGRNNIGCVGK